jgi:hypothetical protein
MEFLIPVGERCERRIDAGDGDGDGDGDSDGDGDGDGDEDIPRPRRLSNHGFDFTPWKAETVAISTSNERMLNRDSSNDARNCSKVNGPYAAAGCLTT